MNLDYKFISKLTNISEFNVKNIILAIQYYVLLETYNILNENYLIRKNAEELKKKNIITKNKQKKLIIKSLLANFEIVDDEVVFKDFNYEFKSIINGYCDVNYLKERLECYLKKCHNREKIK